jgi:putative MATE family efflux protein
VQGVFVVKISQKGAIPGETEPISKTLIKLAAPAVALNGLQVLNGLLDTFFIGHLPKSALTAHGAAMNIMFLMFSLAMAVSVAAGALVSRAYGANRPEEYREANRQCYSLTLMFGLVFGLVCFGIAQVAGQILIPANDPVARGLFTQFLSIYALSIPGTAIITTLSGSMRGIGDTVSPMFISGIQILLHMVLNFFFIFPGHQLFGISIPGLGLGMAGAGWALVISGWVSALIYSGFCTKTKLGKVSISLPVRAWVNRILNIAVPSALQSVMRVGSFTLFTLFLKDTPTASDALGALRIGITIESIMFMPAFGLSVAAGALVGQSLGAGDPKRAEKIGWLASHYAGIIILCLSIPIFIYANVIAGNLTGGDKPLMALEAANYIRILIVTEILFGYAMVIVGAMQGAGDAKRTLWLTIIALWLIRVPMAFFMTKSMGSQGAWIAMSASQALHGFFAMYLWKQGKWKTVKV